jgi:hypothetical protein
MMLAVNFGPRTPKQWLVLTGLVFLAATLSAVCGTPTP